MPCKYLNKSRVNYNRLRLFFEPVFSLLFNYRIYSRISRIEKILLVFCPKLGFFKISEQLYNHHLKGMNMKKTVIFVVLVYDPRISRIEKVFVKFCPKFLDLYASKFGKYLMTGLSKAVEIT